MTQIKFVEAERITKSLQAQFIKEIKIAYEESLKAIRKEVADTYAKYAVDGKLDMATLNKKTANQMTRLQTLERNINVELTKLNRGTPQATYGYLSDVYQANYDTAIRNIGNMTFTDVSSWTRLDRGAIYQSVQRPMAQIALTDNANAVRRNIKRAITQGIVQGKSIDNMASDISNVMGQNANNAVRIARTETTGIMGEARQTALEEAQANGIRLKKVWVSSIGDRTRESHEALNGQSKNLDEAFDNGLMYPGDQSGPPEEVINCRCTMVTELLD